MFGAPFVQVSRICLLDMARIEQHQVGQRAGSGSGVDRTVIPLLDQVGQVATVIDMRVAENDRVHVRMA